MGKVTKELDTNEKSNVDVKCSRILHDLAEVILAGGADYYMIERESYVVLTFNKKQEA